MAEALFLVAARGLADMTSEERCRKAERKLEAILGFENPQARPSPAHLRLHMNPGSPLQPSVPVENVTQQFGSFFFNTL